MLRNHNISFECVIKAHCSCERLSLSVDNLKEFGHWLWCLDILYFDESTERAWSGRKSERALRPGSRIHLGRGGQSVNSMKLYKISLWEPGRSINQLAAPLNPRLLLDARPSHSYSSELQATRGTLCCSAILPF